MDFAYPLLLLLLCLLCRYPAIPAAIILFLVVGHSRLAHLVHK